MSLVCESVEQCASVHRAGRRVRCVPTDMSRTLAPKSPSAERPAILVIVAAQQLNVVIRCRRHRRCGGAGAPRRRSAAACVGGLRIPWQAGSSDGRDSAVQTPSYDSCSLLRDNGVGALRVSSTLAVSSARVDHATCQRTCAPACNTPRFSHSHSLNSLLQFLPGPHKLPYPQCLPSAPLPPWPGTAVLWRAGVDRACPSTAVR